MIYIADRNSAPLSFDIADYPDGIIIPVDKPLRWTSADVIRKLKFAACRHFGKKNLKVGHAGTLDPLATGVLLVCIGNATKKAEELLKHDKEYIAGITFGATTPSYDLEKEIDCRYDFGKVSRENVLEVLATFVGEQQQVAPLFSAKSIDGVRAYEMARKMYKAGEKVDDSLLRASTIIISETELLSFTDFGVLQETPLTEDNAKNCRINMASDDPSLPHALVRIACSKGTYIRAFARDLGESLETGAFLNSLIRSRSGDFDVRNAVSVTDAMNLLGF